MPRPLRKQRDLTINVIQSIPMDGDLYECFRFKSEQI